ncbi:MAG: hypothetical protein FJ271_09830 [Planctomycetes bacterium]|nr:hypothetical protein [Planctomycetota bacterium]
MHRLIICCLPLLLAGCLPRVVWLPDSSGLVYTAGPGGNLLHVHDLSRGKPLVKDLPGRVNVPAVSPDGKLLAVALLAGNSPNSRVRILVFDRAGRETHRSDEIPWHGETKLYSARPLGAETYWEPAGTRLLIAGDDRLGFYDLKSRQFRAQPGNFGPGPLIFGGEWRGPRSKDMLVRCDGQFALLDWNGAVQSLRGLNVEASNQVRDAMTTWPAIFSSRWDDDIAEVGWNSDRFRFDLARRTVAFSQVLPDFADGRKVVQQRFSFGAGKPSVRVVELVARNFGLGGDGQEGTFGMFRVEVLKPGQDQPSVLVPKISGCVQLVPSPDRRLLAVDCLADSADRAPQERTILVVDAAGRLISHIGTIFPKVGQAE